jgi:PX domain/EF hand
LKEAFAVQKKPAEKGARFKSGGGLLLIETPKRTWTLHCEDDDAYEHWFFLIKTVVDRVRREQFDIVYEQSISPVQSDDEDNENDNNDNVIEIASRSDDKNDNSNDDDDDDESTVETVEVDDALDYDHVLATRIKFAQVNVERGIENCEDDAGAMFHVYTVVCKTSNAGQWRVKRRYRQFYRLHQALRTRFAWWESSSALPARKFFGNRDPQFVEQRRDGLRHYFEAVDRYGESLLRCTDMLVFLDRRSSGVREFEARAWWHRACKPLLDTVPSGEVLYGSSELRALCDELRVSTVGEDMMLPRRLFFSLLSRTTKGMNRETANVLFSALDADKRGMLDFAQLARGLSHLAKGSRRHRVDLAFDVFDANHDGMIDKAELYSLALYLDWFSGTSSYSRAPSPSSSSSTARRRKASSSAAASESANYYIEGEEHTSRRIQDGVDAFFLRMLEAGGAYVDPDEDEPSQQCITLPHFRRAIERDEAILCRLGIPYLYPLK